MVMPPARLGLGWCREAIAGHPKLAVASDRFFMEPRIKWIVPILLAASIFSMGQAPTKPSSSSQRKIVRDAIQLRRALTQASPGTEILLAPGVYKGKFYAQTLRGAEGRPIAIGAADPKNKPVIRGGEECLQLVSPAYVELRDLVIERSSGNGLNIDDGGSSQTPAHHVTLSGLVIRNVGYNGVKLAGVEHFVIKNLVVDQWPDNGACGIDMVGCHDGVVESTAIRSTDRKGFGLQIKGGSARITVRYCRFQHAGWRGIQIGGSTGMPFFRPRPQGFEAKDIIVERNIIVGSEAALTFVNVDGAIARYNTIYRPNQWAIRILQETVRDDFVPSRNGIFTDNIVAFRSDELATPVNVGPNTAPETFRFARNWWYCLDAPKQSRPSLPTAEEDGHSGVDPQFENIELNDFRLREGSPAARAGVFANNEGDARKGTAPRGP
jgi:hypothetical protein